MLDDGPGIGRRKKVYRTPAERAAIVAESYVAGETVSSVAQRHEIAPSQLSIWRSAARAKAQPPFAAVEIAPDVLSSAPMPTSVNGRKSFDRTTLSRASSDTPKPWHASKSWSGVLRVWVR